MYVGLYTRNHIYRVYKLGDCALRPIFTPCMFGIAYVAWYHKMYGPAAGVDQVRRYDR